jgi:hypothetical protein
MHPRCPALAGIARKSRAPDFPATANNLLKPLLKSWTAPALFDIFFYKYKHDKKACAISKNAEYLSVREILRNCA